jgi:hypothetical protein
MMMHQMTSGQIPPLDMPVPPLDSDDRALMSAAMFLRYDSRADGWTRGRQAAFLMHLADHGVVADAAKAVGKSLAGAYALRRQARGYGFGLGWEAAMILARRVVVDKLMACAIEGERAEWVRADGRTTYTRFNAKIALGLLDRVSSLSDMGEVMAVVARFDWFVTLLDQGASPAQLWALFFDEALCADDREARNRVRSSLLLSEDSDDSDEDEDADDEDDEDADVVDVVEIAAEDSKDDAEEAAEEAADAAGEAAREAADALPEEEAAVDDAPPVGKQYRVVGGVAIEEEPLEFKTAPANDTARSWSSEIDGAELDDRHPDNPLVLRSILPKRSSMTRDFSRLFP